MITIVDALVALRPNAEYTTNGDDIIWLDSEQTQPSDDEIRNEVVRLSYLEEVEQYKVLRAAEYPPYGDYLDGVVKDDQSQIDAYVAACRAVKDKYPKASIDTDELASRKAQALANHQLEEYTAATARLAQYIIADGRAEVTEMQDSHIQLADSDGTPQFDSDGSPIYEQVEVITVTAIDPVDATVGETNYNSDNVPFTVQVENPLITKDNEERAAAQATIDATPQPVIDEYNS